MRLVKLSLIAALLCIAAPALAQSSTQLYLGGAIGGLRHHLDRDYGSAEIRHLFHSWGRLSIGYGGVFEVSRKEDYLGADLTLDYRFSPQWGASITSGPGYYSNHSFNLGSHLEFRSGLEFYYVFSRGWRLAMGIFHYSNAGIADHNPGTESLRVAVVIPLRQ